MPSVTEIFYCAYFLHKQVTGTDKKFVANSVYEIQSVLFMLINYSCKLLTVTLNGVL